MEEIWKNAVGFIGYEVSSLGCVRSKWNRNGSGLTNKYHFLRSHRDRNGYLRVGLCRSGKQIKIFVHRLVLEAFSGPCPEGYETRHLNGNRQDNKTSNLIWGTTKDNRHDRICHGRHNKGSNHPMTKLAESDVLKIKLLLKETELTEHEIGERFGVSREVVSKIKQGKNWGWLKI